MIQDAKDTMKQFLQKQPRRLTIAKHKLGMHQMRVMAHIVNRLQPFMSMEVDYTKPMEDIWLEIGVSELTRSGNVKPLRESLDGLMKKIVRIMHYMPEKAVFLEIGTPIIQEYQYEHGSSCVKLKISGRLLPQMIDLAKGYTKYSLDVAFQTSSPNTFKLYQYFSHFRDKKQIQCNVDTLRQWLQLEGKYAMPKDIKQKILGPAILELKEKADVWFDIAERVTKGRKMIGWKFNIYTKKEEKSLAKTEQAKALANAVSPEKASVGMIEEGKKKAEELWEKCCEGLKKELTFDNYDTWITPIQPEGFKKDTLQLGVPNAFFAEKVEKEFLPKINERIKIELIALDEKKKREKRAAEKKNKEEAFLDTLQKQYGLSERQAIKIETVMEISPDKRKLVKEVLKEVDAAKRDGKIRSSVGGATVAKLQLKLGIKLY